AGAHGHQRGADVAALQLVQRGGEQPGAGAADGVAQGDGTPVDVDPVRVGLVHAEPGQHDGGERLVDLEQVDVADVHAAALEHPLGGRDGTVQVVVGLVADQALGHDPGPRRQSQVTGPVGVGQQDG